MAKVKGALFDMDGLMFDTERIYGIYWRETSRELGYPMDDAMVSKMCGAVRDFQVWAIHDGMGADAPAEQIIDETHRLTREHIATNPIPIKEGLVELLQALRARGIPIAIATGTRRVWADDMLARSGMSEYIDAMICGDEVSACKPNPEIFLKAAALIGVPPQECIVLEDSYNGIRAARAAGAQPIMVADTMQPTDEIRALCAGVVGRLDEVIEYL
jgi:HAD superfamily hydrolase (TIGR01509 family)